MKYKRSLFAIPFILYPAICTLLLVPEAESRGMQLVMAPVVGALFAGLTLLPWLLLIERLPKPANFIRGVIQSAVILIVGAFMMGSIYAFLLNHSTGLPMGVQWELVLYSKPMAAYILCSLVYMALVEKKYSR